MGTIRVYYNSACPICKLGIESQQCRMGGSQEEIEWLDVHANPALVCDVNSDLESVRERLHVRSDDGLVHVGSDAMAVLFKHTKGQRAIGRLLGWPVVRTCARWSYNIFARALYTWNRALHHW